MASSTTYQRILNLIKKWPIDENKAGRDFGQFLRVSIDKASAQNKFTPENQEYWDRQYLSLQKLINNEHFKKYPRILSSSATGLTGEQCSLALSNDFLQQLKEEDKSVFKRIFTVKLESKKE